MTDRLADFLCEFLENQEAHDDHDLVVDLSAELEAWLAKHPEATDDDLWAKAEELWS